MIFCTCRNIVYSYQQRPSSDPEIFMYLEETPSINMHITVKFRNGVVKQTLLTLVATFHPVPFLTFTPC